VAKTGKRGEWLPPRGRHKLPREVIERSQRERVLEGTMRVVAEKGYEATKIADLTAEAGISRTTFYQLFEDKEACFLAAYDHCAEALIRRVTAAYEAQRSWPEAMRAGLETLLGAVAAEPGLARVGLLDYGAAGPAAQQRHLAAVKRVTPLFEEGRDFAPGGRALPANTSRMAIGGVLGLVSDALVAEEAAQLPQMQNEVLAAALRPYLGDERAAEYVEAWRSCRPRV
jgi:AcrR family transcriptional regulator